MHETVVAAAAPTTASGSGGRGPDRRTPAHPAIAWEISATLQIPRSTATRVLRIAGLNRLRNLEPAPLMRRYEWPHAGDLPHVDIKFLGSIRGTGHRVMGDRSPDRKLETGRTHAGSPTGAAGTVR